jgi:CRP/FNR family transcriptional regulator, cyclic AMP receptor protein
MDVASALRACPLFKDFTGTGIQILAGIAVQRVFPKGAPLFVENMLADSLLIVADGSVRLSARSERGEDVALGEVGAGEPLGELALVQQGQRACTATALTDVTAVEIRSVDFQALAAQKPQACVKLLMGVVTHYGQKVRESRDLLRALVGRV